MRRSGYLRTSAVRQRPATPDLVISPAWLKVLETGYRKVVVVGGVEEGITAHLRCNMASDILDGDTLVVLGLSYKVIGHSPKSSSTCVWFLQRM